MTPASQRSKRTTGGPFVLFRSEGVHIVVLWLVLGSILAQFATHVRDYVDFDAGRYERLAISIARSHSLVPRVNGVNIHYYSLLYPILIAPFFVAGQMWTDLRNAGMASAYIMSSASIPAFLLTRRVTARRWAPYLVAVLTTLMPWIVSAFFLMTEVAAYPAFAWAIFAMVVAVSTPSLKHDLLAIFTALLAFFARGELITLLFVFPLALVGFELGRASAPTLRGRLSAGARTLFRGHRLIVIVTAVIGSAALILYAIHRLAAVIGIYGVYSSAGTLAWGRLPRSLAEHLASFSLGFGVVPFVVALAWMGANLLRPPTDRAAHAFACVASFATLVIFVQATNFDLVVNAYIHDRFLLYFVPVILIGAVLAVTDGAMPKWSLLAPALVVAAGFAFGDIPPVSWQQFAWLDLDTPISTVYRVLTQNLGGLGHVRAVLVALALAGTALFALAAHRLRPGVVTIVLFGFCSVAMATTTMWVFVRTFDSPDRNGRQVTASWHGTLDWIDQAVGPNASVTAVQYPLTSDWFINEQSWVSFEYFNKSIVRDARLPASDAFDYDGLWFPKLTLHFDTSNGTVAESPTRWVVESPKETRFQLWGPEQMLPNGTIVDAGSRWRLQWVTSGLYDDGWTRPGVPMLLRAYPQPGQRKPLLRGFTFVLRTNSTTRRLPVTLSAQGTIVHETVTPNVIDASIHVCVPPHGYAEIRMDVRGSSSIPGDLASLAEQAIPRRGGVFIAAMGEANEVGPVCTAPAAR